MDTQIFVYLGSKIKTLSYNVTPVKCRYLMLSPVAVLEYSNSVFVLEISATQTLKVTFGTAA